MAKNKDIKYINRDFTFLRNSLINYTKTYFPNTYNDFSPSSPGMMIMELASYVGDVLSFYQDNQFQETLIQYARQNNNLYELAYMFGYKPKVSGAAITSIDFYQKVPALGVSPYGPDFSYCLTVQPNSVIQSTSTPTVEFLVEDPIDFSVSSSSDPTEIVIDSLNSINNNPEVYLLKKRRNAVSATINTTSFSFGTPEKFSTVEINDANILGILDIVDSDNNEWYEVDYLAQDMVFDSIKNTNPNDPNTYTDQSTAPYLLKLKQIQRRFVTRFLNSGSLQIQFGAGTSTDSDENITPNPDNVGLGLPFEKDKLTTSYSPTNFIFTNTYGIAPSNTTLTVRYLTGGGVEANVPVNDLTTFSGIINFNSSNLTNTSFYYNSFGVTNPEAASGGGDGDTIEEIRQNTLSQYSTQLRNVTQDDYLVRALSMPPKYGVVAKAYIEKTKAQNVITGEIPSTLDLYILSYNQKSQLVTASNALKQNLSTYLSQYRVVGDSINIKDAFVINIGINFDIIVLPDYNNNEVLGLCILALQDYFSITNWQINQPIILKDLYILLDKLEGVQTVKNVTITNKVGTALGYSQYAYDIEGATINNVIYPSLDPMIFEIKKPTTDIQGRVVPL